MFGRLLMKHRGPVKPLKRRQFMRVLALNGFDLNEIEAMILSIEDTQAPTVSHYRPGEDATDFPNVTTQQIIGK